MVLLVGKPSSQITISASATYTAKVQKDSSTTPSKPTTSTLALGDYVSMTPTKSSFTTDKSKTGYSTTQTINPQELKLWRVISKNSDGTYDVVSEYVSSTMVYFKGRAGYQNLVGYLNVLASQYENSTYTKDSRHFGYNAQTEYITDTSKFTSTAPWVCSTGESCNPVERQGGGDTGYTKDYNLVKNVFGTLSAKIPGGTNSTNYFIASRYYDYASSTYYEWRARYLNGSSLGASSWGLYYSSESSLKNVQFNSAIRPILILKSGLKYSGSGTSSSPYVPSR